MSSNLDDFLAGYAEAMAWANTYVPADPGFGEGVVAQGDGGPHVWAEPDNGAWFAVSDSGERQAIDLTDARAFYANESVNLWATGQTDFSQHGHDFALTRNGHGAGFWDRGYGPVGDRLTDAAESYGEADIIM